jgi:hypothetical protein
MSDRLEQAMAVVQGQVEIMQAVREKLETLGAKPEHLKELEFMEGKFRSTLADLDLTKRRIDELFGEHK